ncbi:MAG: sulfatase-like hydrolase/transferase, partial [Armatimonadota bacterium]
WAEMYDPADMEPNRPPAEPDTWVPQPAAEHQRLMENDSLGITQEDNGKIRALYYAKISHIDSWIGEILDALQDRQMLDNSTLLFWSDHGEMLGDHGRLSKSVFYEESAHVPLIIRPPGYEHPGGVCDRLVSQIDCVPTMLETAGCEQQPQQFGRSLLPLVDDPQAQHNDAVFSEIDHRVMIRTERHKMVLSSEGQPLNLYDMHNDPEESCNLVGRDNTQSLTADLRDRVLNWMLSTQLRNT